MRPALLAGLLGLAACGAPSATNGNWVGAVTPRTSGPACLATRGLAQIRGDSVSFSPNQGTWTLIGTLEADGRVTAERIGTGVNRQPFETRLEARLSGTELVGTYTTPRCVADVVLHRT